MISLSKVLFLWLAFGANIAILIVHFISPNGGVETTLLLISSTLIVTAIIITGQQTKHVSTDTHNKTKLIKQLLTEQGQLIDLSITESGKEFRTLIEQLLQVQEVIDSAIQKLSSSLFGLKDESTDQQALLQKLVDDLMEIASGNEQEEQTEGLHAFLKATEEMLDEFANVFSTLNSASSSMFENFEIMRKQIEDVTNMLDDVNQITSQTDLLALNAAIEAARAGEAGRGFAVVASEVRSLSKRTGQFNEQIRTSLTEINNSINKVDSSLDKARSFDTNIASKSRTHISGMKNELISLNKNAFDQSKQIEFISSSIHKLVMEGVISLQFDDIVRQLLEKVNTQVQALNEFHHEVMSAQKEDMSIGFERRLPAKIKSLKKALSVKQESLEHINTSGVQQSSIETGEIDLF